MRASSLRYFFQSILLGMAVALAWAPAVTCLAQHSDVLLANVGGQVDVGSASDIDGPNEAIDLDATVFESILIAGFAPPTPADYETNEPGFFALHGVSDAADLTALGASALPGGAIVTAAAPSFTVNGNGGSLFFWNGMGAVDFQPVSVAQPGVSFAFSPPAFGTTGVNGDLDDHPVFQVNDTAGTPGDGVYLISPTVGVAGLADSDNFFVVMLVDRLIQGEDERELVEAALEGLEEGLTTDAVVDFGGGVTKDFAFYEEAVEWVESNLVVPEPSGLAMGVAAVSAFVLRERRRRRD
jgi:hypothetical protein